MRSMRSIKNVPFFPLIPLVPMAIVLGSVAAAITSTVRLRRLQRRIKAAVSP